MDHQEIMMMPAPIDTRLPSKRHPHRIKEVSLLRQLPTIREMLTSLETLTIAGQQEAMIKVVAFIRWRAGEALGRMGRNNQRTAADLLEHLAIESERPLPDVRSFRPRAESLVALLAAVAEATMTATTES